MNTEVGPKRVGLMHELLPHAARFGVLVNPKNALAEFAVKDAQVAVGGVGQLVEISKASTDDEIDAAFASLTQKRVDALLVASPELIPLHSSRSSRSSCAASCDPSGIL